ncbi:MAG: thioredoxin family protein [Campylobacterota bacterium]|nr:thioredoxin family protein [Campylobacterota bacterium]
MIKKFTLTILLLISSLFASEVNWAKDYQAGLNKAQKENKMMLFIISRDSCKYCVILKNTTLKNSKIVKALNKNFISVTAWINENDYIPMDLRQNTPGLPGIWFIQPSGEPMFQPIMGYLEEDKFLEALAIVQEEFKKQNKGKK